MRNLPTDLLRTFVTVSELGGFTQAGQLLGRSQPAISLQIKRLEDLVGQTLLNRRGQQLMLTAAGQTLLTYARQILSLNDKALAQLSKTPVQGKIKFGIPSEFATTLMPKVLGHFAKAYPHVRLEVNCALSKQLLSEPERRGYDLILALHDNPDDAYDQHMIEDDLVWVSGDDQEAANSQPLPLITAPEGCIYRKRAINTLNQHGLGWRIVYTIQDLSGIKSAIEAGLGVTVLARRTVPDSLCILRNNEWLPPLGKIGISLINQQSEDNDAITRMMAFVRASI